MLNEKKTKRSADETDYNAKVGRISIFETENGRNLDVISFSLCRGERGNPNFFLPDPTVRLSVFIGGPGWMADLIADTQEMTSTSSFATKRYSAPLRSLCVCVCMYVCACVCVCCVCVRVCVCVRM